MRKTCAKKLFAVVLTLAMILGTSVSAMALTVASSTEYSGDTATVTSVVSGAADNEMVTYMATDAASVSAANANNINFIDQKTGTGSALEFGYTGNYTDGTTKIFVGSQNTDTPVQSTVQNSAKLYENNIENAWANDNLLNEEGNFKTINLSFNSKLVTSVYVNATPVYFVRMDDTNDGLGAIGVTAAISKTDSVYVSYKMPTILDAGAFIAQGKATNPTVAEVATGGTSANPVYRTGDLVSSLRYMGIFGQCLQNEFVRADNFYSIPDGDFTVPAGGYTNVTAGKIIDSYDSNNQLVDGYYRSLPQSMKDYLLDAGIVAIETTDDPEHDNYKVVKGATETIDIPGGTVFENAAQYGIMIASGGTIDANVNVPVDGDYYVVVRDFAFQAARYASVTFDDDDSAIYEARPEANSSDNLQVMAKAPEKVTLSAGTHKVAIKANGGLLRFDFLALVPVGGEGDALMNSALYTATETPETAKTAFNAYTAKSAGEAVSQVNLGTVIANGNTLTAFGRVVGDFVECGINFDGTNYRAAGVSSENNGFAISLVDEDNTTTYVGKLIKAYADGLSTPAYEIQ